MAATSISIAANKLTTPKPPFSLQEKSSCPFSTHLSFSNSSISLQKVTISTNSRNLNPRAAAISNVLMSAKEEEPRSVSESRDPKPTVLVSEKLGEAGLDLLRSFGDVECLYNLSPEELCAKISECDALIVRSGTKVTRRVFEAAKGRLKVVGRAGVGIDNVDLQAATEFGCLVVNAPTANTIAAAEHGIALLAAMARNVAQADASMKAGKWQRNKYVGVSMIGKTLAVMGFGKVGSEVARRAKGLGMNVIAHDPYAPADRARALGVDLVSFDQAISTADFISLHMPLTPTTNKIFNDETFRCTQHESHLGSTIKPLCSHSTLFVVLCPVILFVQLPQNTGIGLRKTWAQVSSSASSEFCSSHTRPTPPSSIGPCSKSPRKSFLDLQSMW